MTIKKFLIIFGLCFVSNLAFALQPEEQQPDELFSTYFARLTRGGTFSGIYLNAPDSFATAFHQFIRRNFWIGPVDKTQKELRAQNFDIWGDIYKTTTPQKFIHLSSNWNQIVKNNCGSDISIVNLQFSDWPLCIRKSFIEEVLFEQATGSELAKLYQLDLNQVKAKTEIFLLKSSDFSAKLKEAGWEGPVYFRGATVPNPQDNEKRWILLNDDYFKQYTGFDNSFLQMQELAGIANHELSHVMQDLLGKQLGLDIQVRNAEQVLLIEGHAEYLAEKSFVNTGLFFKLFANEQAVEVVNREGNSQSGQLFPYTIGLPFVATLFDQHDVNTINQDILNMLGDQKTLATYLKENYK